MIFKSVGSLDGKTEKSFFLEQIQVYRRLVEVFCERHGIKPVSYTHLTLPTTSNV